MQVQIGCTSGDSDWSRGDNDDDDVGGVVCSTSLALRELYRKVFFLFRQGTMRRGSHTWSPEAQQQTGGY